jgi:hypothetical protein
VATCVTNNLTLTAVSGHNKVIMCLVHPEWQDLFGMYIENYPHDLCTHIVVGSVWMEGSLWNFTSLDASNSSKQFCKKVERDD